MKIPMLDLVRQYHQTREEIDRAMQAVLEGGAYIMGPQVKAFEEQLAAFLGVKHCIGVASGSDALIISLQTLGIGAGDKVILPTFTFFATAGAVARLGAVPVFADIEPLTYNMDMEMVENLLQSDPDIKAIVPVHIFGQPVDMGRLLPLAEKYRIKVVEDACQAINADLHLPGAGSAAPATVKAGTAGDTGCFSFFPSKNLSCYGDGGAIVTNDDQLAELTRILRVHGSSSKYIYNHIGYNSRLDTLQAAVLSVKLKYLHEWTAKRRTVAANYNAGLAAAGLQERVQWPEVTPGHVFHQYVINTPQRDGLAVHLKEQGIATAVYYPKPLHLQDCFAGLHYQAGQLPVSEAACERVLALPVDPELRGSDIEYIVNAIKAFFK